MIRPRNYRALFLLVLLLGLGATLLLREHRPSILRPGLRLRAYVSTADGVVAVVDLVRLAVVARVPVGPTLSGLREHPTRPEIWGVSTIGGFVWVLDAATNQIAARIPVGAAPYAVDFSPDGLRAYVTASGANTLLVIDCQTRKIAGQTGTGAGSEPVLARSTPDGKRILVVNRREGTLRVYDATSLALQINIPVVEAPEDIAILPDGSAAFVLSRQSRLLSAVDLKRGVLLSNLELSGTPSSMILKPDGGELYVISSESHGLQVINTWTREVGDSMELGWSPTRGVLSADGSLFYVSDAAAGHITPVDILNRRVLRGDHGREVMIPVGQSPSGMRFDPGESLLLVANEGSGDVSVVRVRTNSLLTMIPVGNEPRELAVKLF